MAQKLSVQIALEGGKEVERQLEGIGEAGQQAFQKISQSAEQAGGFRNLKISEVTAELKQMGVTGTESINQIKQAVRTAGRFENITSGIQGLEQSFDRAAVGANRATAAFGLTRKELSGLRAAARQIDLGPMGGQLVAFGRIGAAFGPLGISITAVGAAIAGAAAATIGFASSIQKASIEANKLGLNVQQYDRMRQTLEQLGVSSQSAGAGVKQFSQTLEQTKIDEVNKAFKELQEAATRGFGAQGTAQLKVLQDAAQGTGKAAELAAEKLKELDQVVPPNTIAEQFKNISESIKGLSQADAAQTVIQALAAIKDPAQQAALAMKFFGDEGAEIARKLQTLGPAAVNAQSAIANLITPEAAAKADALDSAINRLESSLRRFGTVQFAPALTAGLDAITGAVDRLNQRAQTNPWGSLAQGASLLNPINLVVQSTILGLQTLTGTAQQAGQAAAQAGQQGAQGFQSWDAVLQKAAEGTKTWEQVLAQGAGTSQQTAQQGASAFDVMTQAVQRSIDQVKQFASSIASITWDAISSAGVAAWDAITGAIQRAIDAALRFIGLKPSAPATGGGKARGGLIGGVGSGTSDSNLAWLSRGEHVMPASVVRQPGVLGVLEAMRRGGGIPHFADGGGMFIRGFQDVGGGGISDKIANWIVQIAQANNTAVRAILDLIDSLNRIHENLSNSLFRVTQDMNQVTRELVNRGLARGGLLGGRGTGTSDSNLAWVSRGEYITPARAVAQPGVLAFLEALRRSGGNLRHVLDGMGRFALGGLVPAFAGSGMSHVTINFPGTPPISGLRASAGVVEQLQRAAALAQVRSGGRKPSRYS